MKAYKIVISEKVSVWKEIGVVIEAKSKKELDALLKSGEFTNNILDFDYDLVITDCSTEKHIDYDTTNYRILSEKEN